VVSDPPSDSEALKMRRSEFSSRSQSLDVLVGGKPSTDGLDPEGREGGHDGRVGINNDDISDRDNIVEREVGSTGVLPKRVGIAGLIDANRADAATRFADDIGSQPADAIRHFLKTDLSAARGGFVELLRRGPAVSTKDDVGIHVTCFF